MKTRKRADSNTTSQSRNFFWDSSDKGGKKPVTLATQLPGPDDSGKEHDHRTAEDDVNDLLGGSEVEMTSLPQTNLGPKPAPQAPEPPPQPDPQETEEETTPKVERQEILEIHDNESLGDALTKLRASVNCTLVDLFNKTKIPINKIKALEEGNYREIPDINIGMDYIRKLCAEYVVSQEIYLDKFKKEHEEYYKTNDFSPEKEDGEPEAIGKLPSKPISIPGLLIVSLIIILCLFILGGLAKVFIKSNSVKSNLPLSDFTQVKRIPIKALNIPSGN